MARYGSKAVKKKSQPPSHPYLLFLARSMSHYSDASLTSLSANSLLLVLGRALMAAIGSMKGLNYSVQSSGAVSLEVTKTIPCPGRRSYENGVGI